jgi:hypothetical protein
VIPGKRRRLSLIFSRRSKSDPGPQKVVSCDGIGHHSILLHRKILQALLFHYLYRVFDRGRGREGDSIVDHDVFCGQFGKILAGFQRAEDIEFADESKDSFRSSTTGAPDVWVVSNSSATTIPFWPAWRTRVLVSLICPTVRIPPAGTPSSTNFVALFASTSHFPFSFTMPDGGFDNAAYMSRIPPLK